MSDQDEVVGPDEVPHDRDRSPVARARIPVKQKEKKFQAAIYEYYYKNAGDAEDLFRCMECDKVVKKGKGGQTNLRKHFERYHVTIYKEKLQTISQV